MNEIPLTLLYMFLVNTFISLAIFLRVELLGHWIRSQFGRYCQFFKLHCYPFQKAMNEFQLTCSLVHSSYCKYETLYFCAMVSHYSFNLYFLTTNDAKHLCNASRFPSFENSYPSLLSNFRIQWLSSDM